MISRPESAHRRPGRQHGFTLIELILVILITGILAAIAVPRYIALGTDARIAAVKTLVGALRSTAENVRAMCNLAPACDYTTQGQHLTIGGHNAFVSFGWLLSGYGLGDAYIDGWINYTGFTASASGTVTLFTLDGSPNPANCSASYDNPNERGQNFPVIYTVLTSGC